MAIFLPDTIRLFQILLRLSLLSGITDFLLLEEADTFLALADDPTSPKVDEAYYDPEGDILLLESLLNSLKNLDADDLTQSRISLGSPVPLCTQRKEKDPVDDTEKRIGANKTCNRMESMHRLSQIERSHKKRPFPFAVHGSKA
ncbi:hypothetical protein Tco_1028820 [Tanacetum coccineum]|uniref:Uncharacterized protein n=1 Tax=Tanacetum coccineum TaxID=301880 RepID=A0ABQ5G1Q0_9ASTR